MRVPDRAFVAHAHASTSTTPAPIRAVAASLRPVTGSPNIHAPFTSASAIPMQRLSAT